VNSQVSVSVDCALHGILRRNLGSMSIRAEGNPEVDDLSGCRVVHETVDVNRLEGGARISTTVSGRGSVVLSLFLSGVSRPVLFHHRADDDVEHRVLDVLFDESAVSRVVESGRVNLGLVLVGFTVRQDLWAARVQESVTNRVNPALNRTTRVIVGRIWPKQHCGLNTATSVVAHHDDVSDAQRLNAVRQHADRVVIDRLELVRDVPLGEERARRRGEDRFPLKLGNHCIPGTSTPGALRS